METESISRVTCRDKQYRHLHSLLAQNVPPQAVFIYGQNATGKTLVIKTLLQNVQTLNVFVNLVECYTPRLIYEQILGCLLDHNSDDDDDAGAGKTSPPVRCDNMSDFVRNFSQQLQERNETFYIVLDKAERLRDMDSNILPTFLRLGELTGVGVCVILISNIIWEKFWSGTGFCDPVIVHFPEYSKSDVVRIMCLDCPEDQGKDFYHTYCELLLSIFHAVCRDITELRYLAALNFPKYCEPINNGLATRRDVGKLWRNIEPQLRRSMSTVYLREVSSMQYESMDTTTSQGVSSRSSVELPFYSKYLLIAAYLASYNPANSDRRFFSKQRQQKKSKRNTAPKSERKSYKLQGPKAFSLDRLMAIFHSIIESKVSLSASIFSQISSLVSLKLLAQVSADDNLEAPKYKCLVSFDFIRSISRQVEFNIVHYLFDYI